MNRIISCIGNVSEDHLFWVDQIPLIDDVSTIRKYIKCFGGKGAIVANILSSLSCTSHLITVIPDTSSPETLDFLMQYGTNIDGIERDENAYSDNRSLITIGKTNQNCISLFSASDCNMLPTENQLSIINESSIIYLSSYNIVASISILRSLKPDSNRRVIVNISPHMLVDSNYVELIKKHADVIIVNRSEYQLLENKFDLPNKYSIFEHFKKLDYLVVTLGAQGVELAMKSKKSFNILPPSANVLTPVGVGDAFSAGIIWGEYFGKSIENSVMMALDLAKISIQSENSCPTLEEMNEFVKIRNSQGY